VMLAERRQEHFMVRLSEYPFGSHASSSN
jgi:hypothetical protein